MLMKQGFGFNHEGWTIAQEEGKELGNLEVADLLALGILPS